MATAEGSTLATPSVSTDPVVEMETDSGKVVVEETTVIEEEEEEGNMPRLLFLPYQELNGYTIDEQDNSVDGLYCVSHP